MNTFTKILAAIITIIVFAAILGIFYAAAAGLTWIVLTAFGITFNWVYPLMGIAAAVVVEIMIGGIKEVWKKI